MTIRRGRETFRRFRALPSILAGAFRLARTGLLAGAGLLAGIAAPMAGAETSVWKVSDGERVVYLGGTIHVLRAEDFPLPAAFERAYNAADEVYFEADYSALMQPSARVKKLMRERLYYHGGRSLRAVLNREAYAALRAYLREAEISLDMMRTVRPGLMMIFITNIEVRKLGFAAQGVDAYFHARAMKDGKPIGQLETIEENIDFLAALGEGNESAFVLAMLRDQDKAAATMESMLSAWRAGNVKGLETHMIGELLAASPETYDALLRQRNLRWLPQIEAMFEDPDTEYVLAGALHMAGEDSLLKYLREKGYTIEQL